MYQVTEHAAVAQTAAERFLTSSTTVTANRSDRAIIDVLADLLRTGLDRDVTAELRDVLAGSNRRGYATLDLLDAAEYEVLDELFTGTVGAARLHSAMISLSEQIARATHTIPALAA